MLDEHAAVGLFVRDLSCDGLNDADGRIKKSGADKVELKRTTTTLTVKYFMLSRRIAFVSAMRASARICA